MQKNKNIYPVTIIKDRYGGVYSGAEWLAFNQYEEHVPDEISQDDTTCANYWNFEELRYLKIGKGNTPDEAYKDLQEKLG